jgi:hypothetical protein
MADYTRSGGISTAKARRKNDAARNTAHGLATRGRTKRGLNDDGDDAVAEPTDQRLPSLVPRARERRRSYLVGDFVHRVTGSHIRLVDTMAPDAPRGAIPPETGSDGKTLRYAVQCLDHGAGPRFFGLLRDAERAVRQSAQWCPECAQLLAARPKVRARNKSLPR